MMFFCFPQTTPAIKDAIPKSPPVCNQGSHSNWLATRPLDVTRSEVSSAKLELGSQGSFPARVPLSLVEHISENQGEFEFGSQKFVWAPCHGQKARSQGTLKSLVVWADDLRLQGKQKLR